MAKTISSVSSKSVRLLKGALSYTRLILIDNKACVCIYIDTHDCNIGGSSNRVALRIKSD